MCPPACSFMRLMFFHGVCHERTRHETDVVCAYVCSFTCLPLEVMVSLCLSRVNPHHLAVIGSFLLYWNPKRHNHTLYGKQSIFGSDIHSASKPQIAPIKRLV